MTTLLEVQVPQMGEGLRSVRVARLLKKEGDWVDEDSDVVEVETAKATIGIAAPASGYICSVGCEVGDEVIVGGVLLKISTAPPEQIVFSGNDNLQVRKGDRSKNVKPQARVDQLPAHQLQLVQAMRVSRDIVIPASVERRVEWRPIDAAKQQARQLGTRVPTSIELICWAVSQAMLKFDKFRSQINSSGEIVRHTNSILGIARRAGGDGLDVNVVEIDQQDDFLSSAIKVRSVCRLPSSGASYHSLAVSDMSSLGITSGQPIVVYPSIATLFIGAPYWGLTGPQQPEKLSNFVLAFDHRLINGAYAADFLKCIVGHLKAVNMDHLQEKQWVA